MRSGTAPTNADPNEMGTKVPSSAAPTGEPWLAMFAKYRPTKTPLVPDAIRCRAFPHITKVRRNVLCICPAQYLKSSAEKLSYRSKTCSDSSILAERSKPKHVDNTMHRSPERLRMLA